MTHEEFKSKYDDANWALMFHSYMDSLSKSMGVKGLIIHRSIQLIIAVLGLVALVLISLNSGYGMLVGVLPLVCAVIFGKISLNIFDIAFLTSIALLFSFMANLTGASESYWVGIIFGVSYILIGLLKYTLMGVMQSLMYSHADIFERVSDGESVVWWRMN